MKRKTLPILLLLCLTALLAGGLFLYPNLQEPKLSAEPALSSEPPLEVDLASPEESDEPRGSASPEPEPVQEQTSAAEGLDLELAPDFSLTNVEGESVNLSDYFGKPIILNFWATWCGPCQAELPYFDESWAKYQDQIQFLMVDLVDGYYETESAAMDFVNGKGYSFPLYFDGEGEGAIAYEIQAIPLTVAISANGTVVARHLGSMSGSDLQELIDALLRE